MLWFVLYKCLEVCLSLGFFCLHFTCRIQCSDFVASGIASLTSNGHVVDMMVIDNTSKNRARQWDRPVQPGYHGYCNTQTVDGLEGRVITERIIQWLDSLLSVCGNYNSNNL